MAVDKSAQGKGLANHLMQAAIDWVSQQNSKKIFLESGTKLKTAIKLYEKFGFKTTQLGAIENSEYSRVDIVMELLLN
jgi:putative acetyltransferase